MWKTCVCIYVLKVIFTKKSLSENMQYQQCVCCLSAPTDWVHSQIIAHQTWPHTQANI